MLKLGVIGTNWITDQFVLAAEATGEFHLTSIYSRKISTAQAFGSKYLTPIEYFDDLDRFFNEGKFDVVYIASPNSLHYEQSVQAIKAGKHVIVEKPACSNPTEMKHLVKLLRQNSEIFYFEAARHIHSKNFALIKQKLKDLKVKQGANLTYKKYSSRYAEFLAGAEPNIFSLDFSGGALQDLGVYLVYDALSWFGFPGEVNYYPVKLRNGIDGSGTAILSYEDFEVVLNIGKTANSYLPGEIYGEKETLLLDNAAELKKVELVDGAGNVTILSVEPEEQNPMIAEAKAFAKLLRDPGSLENKQIQQDWLALAVEVNQVLYELRKSAQIVFKADREF